MKVLKTLKKISLKMMTIKKEKRNVQKRTIQSTIMAGLFRLQTLLLDLTNPLFYVHTMMCILILTGGP